MLKDGAWLRHAGHANDMAARLGIGLKQIRGVEITHPVESNSVFAKMPGALEEKLRARGWHFYTGVITPDESRLMCSWDTTPGDVDDFVADLKDLAA
jgi:threonine aldolase